MIEEAKLQAKSIRSGAAAQQQQQMGSMFGSVLSGIGGMIPTGGGGVDFSTPAFTSTQADFKNYFKSQL